MSKMALLLRSLVRDPRPVSRLIRRIEDELLDDWPAKRMRRSLPAYEPLSFMDDMNRQMASTLNRMQEFVDDMEALDSLASRFDAEGGRNEPEAIVRRTESGGLQLALDMADYKPEDLKIKLVDDHLVVEAETETSGKDSYRKSHFKRWFRLPDDVKVDDIKSRLTDSKRLLIDLPLNKPIDSSNARTIPIEVEQPKQQAIENNQGGPENRQEQGHEQQQRHEEARRSARGQ